jgi:hypothetical protein
MTLLRPDLGQEAASTSQASPVRSALGGALCGFASCRRVDRCCLGGAFVASSRHLRQHAHVRAVRRASGPVQFCKTVGVVIPKPMPGALDMSRRLLGRSTRAAAPARDASGRIVAGQRLVTQPATGRRRREVSHEICTPRRVAASALIALSLRHNGIRDADPLGSTGMSGVLMPLRRKPQQRLHHRQTSSSSFNSGQRPRPRRDSTIGRRPRRSPTRPSRHRTGGDLPGGRLSRPAQPVGVERGAVTCPSCGSTSVVLAEAEGAFTTLFT